VLADNFNQTNAKRAQGDFDGDRDVDFADFTILAENFGRRRIEAFRESLPAASSNSVPPPQVESHLTGRSLTLSLASFFSRPILEDEEEEGEGALGRDYRG
jgi:hypothetical protein